jgi:hypothetical protein
MLVTAAVPAIVIPELQHRLIEHAAIPYRIPVSRNREQPG